jgi:hypothetical protein
MTELRQEQTRLANATAAIVRMTGERDFAGLRVAYADRTAA